MVERAQDCRPYGAGAFARSEQGSDVLRTLQAQLADVEQAIAETKAELAKANEDKARLSERAEIARRQLDECRTVISASDADAYARYFPRLEGMLSESDRRLTVESCDGREREMRDRLQDQIDKEDHKIRRLQEKIVAGMTAYNGLYPSDTREVDASLEATPDYRKMLDGLAADGLPKFEARFKELLNENTIREIANFQSQLGLERQSIKERIDKINQSLLEIDYNPNRYIVLEAAQNIDPEIRDFQQDLRACTEGTLTGSEDAEYSEAKFLQVKGIIERFRGREGSAEADRRWAAKVTDVRLFKQLNLQLLIVTPLQKIHIIEPFVASVGFVHNEDGSSSKLRNLAIE